MSAIHEAITEHFGERCPDFDPDCCTCQAWAEADRIATLEAEMTFEPQSIVYGDLLHRLVDAARKRDEKRHKALFDCIEVYRAEFPKECDAWEAFYRVKDPTP